MGRRLARELAFLALFQHDLGRIPGPEAVRWLLSEHKLSPEAVAFLQEMVADAIAKREEIDNVLQHYSQDWPLVRMASTDRNILRLAVYELLYRSDIPVEVTVNEAVEIAKKYGDEDSGKFVNGVLGTVIRAIRRMVNVPAQVDEGTDE
ncbi:MAG: transcription antitermination factor NusB [Firmicutes bacterium]|nr:transcription antitermination factor NusB [Bacillota bacterium]